jgi:hypothetical protein
MKKHEREYVASFRARYLPYCGVMLLVALPLGLAIGLGGVMAVQYFVHGRPPTAEILRESLLFVLPVVGLVLLASVLVVALFKVHVAEWGLRSFDFWGQYHEIEWAEMEDARPTNLLGLRYLRVLSPGRGTLWVPLFLAEQERFYKLVRDLAGPDHPLVVALEGYG